ncbi:DapH/DapD/GlmU-related protein [Enterococcus raffinosus]
MLRILLNSNIVNQEFFPDIFRKKLMQIYCDSIEKDCHIKQIKFIGGKQLRIGKKTFVNRFCNFFLHPKNPCSYIYLGDEVAIGPDVSFITVTHNFGDASRRQGTTICKPIIVENGCWIGASSIILPEVTIKSGSIVGAGSVVTRDVDTNTLVAGNPARVIRKL